MNLVSNKESSKNDVDKVSIIDKDVLGNDKSVEEWLKDKKEKSVKEWLEKSVDPGEGTKKKWVHSLEVNDNPERVAKSSDELIDDIFTALKNGETSLKKGNSASEMEIIDLSSGGEDDEKIVWKEKGEDEKR